MRVLDSSKTRVLIVRVGAMGDVLHALPAVAALKRARPEWMVDWAVDPRWAPLLVDGPVVDAVHLVSTKEWSRAPFSLATLKSVFALRKQLQAAKYDLVVDMQGTLRSAVIGWMAGAKKFVGYSDPRESAATRFYQAKVERRGVHVVEQGTALLSEAVGFELAPEAVEIPHEEWADNWAAELTGNRKVCVLAPGAGWGAKRWPVEKFAALAREVAAMGFAVVVNAPRKDDALSLELVAASGGAAAQVVCNVTGLIALLRRAALVVGGDSGPVHLAAALGVPVVALFGPTDPARNGPWGGGASRVLRHASSGTSYKRAAEVDAGLARISVDEVVAAVRELI